MNSKGKIFYLLGKSASGKDTVYDRLLQDASLCLKPVVIYTTRPIRTGEIDGVTYHFRNIPFYKQCEKDIHLIESRVYETMLGPWYYFTIDDGQIDLEKSSYLMIGTLESYEKMLRYYGSGVWCLCIWKSAARNVFREHLTEKKCRGNLMSMRYAGGIWPMKKTFLRVTLLLSE